MRETSPARTPPDAHSEAEQLPLAVDLDGTLLLTDTLFEAMAEQLRRRPFWVLWQMILLPFSIAKVKARIQSAARVDIAT